MEFLGDVSTGKVCTFVYERERERERGRGREGERGSRHAVEFHSSSKVMVVLPPSSPSGVGHRHGT